MNSLFGFITCKNCEQKFEEMPQMNWHMKIKHHETEYDRIERIKEAAMEVQHKAKEHSEPEAQNRQAEPQLNPIVAVGKNYDCGDCGIRIKSEIDQKAHISKYHVVSYKCDKCQKSLEKIEDLETHIKTEHNSENLRTKEDQGFVVSPFGGGIILKVTKKINVSMEKKFEDAFVAAAQMIKKANHGPEMFVNEHVSLKVVDMPPQLQVQGVNATIAVTNKQLSGQVNVIFYKTKTLKITKKKNEDPRLVDILAEVLQNHIECLMAGKPSTISVKKPQEQTLKEEDNLKIKCDLCEKTFLSQHGADVHRGKAHTEMKGIFKCTHCGVKTKTKKAIDIHVMKMHMSEAHPTGDVPGKNICDICAEVFQNETKLKEHEDICHRRSKVFHAKVGSHTPGPTNKRDHKDETTDESDEDEKSYTFKCEICKKVFNDEIGGTALGRLLDHKKTCHKTLIVKNTIDKQMCESCDYKPKNENDFKKHMRDVHRDPTRSTSPPPKKRKDNTVETILEFIINNALGKGEPMEVTENNDKKSNTIIIAETNHEQMEVTELSQTVVTKEDVIIEDKRREKIDWHKINEDKVNKRQERIDIEAKLDEERRKCREENLKPVDMKKKNNQEVNKKKVNKTEKTVKDNSKMEKLPTFSDTYCEKIAEKYRKLFILVGLNMDDFMLFRVVPDGLCGSSCVSIHYHLDDSNEGALNTRRNINTTKATHWDDHYRKEYPFDKDGKGDEDNPHEEIVSMTTVKFYYEENYLNLLRHPDGHKMWMTQSDLQVVADMYRKRVHILETEVPEGRVRAKATELELEGSKVGARWTILEPDQAMAHVKDFHDKMLDEVEELFIMNRSLVHFDLMVHKDSRLAKMGTLKFMEEHPESESNGTLSEDENKESIEKAETDVAQKKAVEDKTENEKKNDNQVEKENIKENVNQIDEHIHCIRENETCLAKSNEFDKLKQKVEILQKHMEQFKTNAEVFSLELSKYKTALKEEVEKRSKAEDMVAAMKTIHDIEKQKQLMNINVEKLSEIKTAEIQSQMNIGKETFKCEVCNDKFNTKVDVEEHVKKKHKRKTYNCNKCKNVYTEEIDLDNHMETSHKVEKCEQCNKDYSSQFELKRHMWRSHEGIGCNYCETRLENRHELKRHKMNKHNIMKIPDCKFHEEGRCVDAEECLYNHIGTSKARENILENTKESQKRQNFCKKGLKCDRQDCEIGEDGHKTIKEVPCRFQQRCNKQSCPFKHENSTSDFQGSRNKNRNR